MKKIIKIYIDASFNMHTNVSTWGAYFKCPDSYEKVTLSGSVQNVKNSTIAEMIAVLKTLRTISETRNDCDFIIFCDCKNVSDLYSGIGKTKCLEMGRVLHQLRSEFSHCIKAIEFTPGHSLNDDKSEDAVGNRRAHQLAITHLRKIHKEVA